MPIFHDKKCPFDREPCRADCALFVEHETDGQAFGYCGLLGPFLATPGNGFDLNLTGQHVYPSFYPRESGRRSMRPATERKEQIGRAHV